MFLKNAVINRTVFLLIAAAIGHGQGKTFSMPDSVLLFSNYDRGLIVTTAQSTSEIVASPGASRNLPVARASVGSRGNLIAWGFPVADDSTEWQKVRCALGIYSISEHRWKTYGSFIRVSETAISPDESKVVFVATQRKDGKPEDLMMLLDLRTEQTTELSREVPSSISWAPDGKSIAMDSAVVKVSNDTISEMRVFGERHFTAWSPSGEWIAYVDSSQQRIHLVHPDGTSDHVVKSVKNPLHGHRFFALNPVWSPDSTKILLNQYKDDGDTLDVVLLDIIAGKTTAKSMNGNPILGWAPQPK